jgi:hypothetical protein
MMKIVPIPALGSAHGTDPSELLALSTEARISNDPIYPDETDYNLWVNYAMLPSLHSIFTISTTNVHGDILATIAVTPAYRPPGNSMTPPLLCSMHSTFWRGPMQFEVQFPCSWSDSGRVRIMFIPIGAEGVTITDSNVGDFISHVVDIQGRTTFRFSVPFLGVAPFCHTGSPAEDLVYTYSGLYSGTIKIRLEVPLTVNLNTSTTISCPIIYACGPTMQFSVPRRAWARPSTAATAQAELEGSAPSRWRDAFKQEFPPLIQGNYTLIARHCMSETISSWTEYYSRPTFLESISVADDEPFLLDVEDIIFNENSTFGWIAAAFQCLRGSLRVIAQPISQCQNKRFTFVYNSSNVVASSNIDYVQGASYAGGINDQVLAVQIPQYQRGFYYSANWIIYIQSPASITLYAFRDVLTDETRANFALLCSVGDDWSMGVPSSLPVWKY